MKFKSSLGGAHENIFFWDVTPRHLVENIPRAVVNSALKVVVVNVYQTTRCLIPQDGNLFENEVVFPEVR